MDVRVEFLRKLSSKELMLSNCGSGEDSWRILWRARTSNQSGDEMIEWHHRLNGYELKQILGNRVWTTLRKNSVSWPGSESLQFSSVVQSCPTLWDPMNCSTSGLTVHHQLLDLTQAHVHRVSDDILPSHPLLSPSPPAPNPSQHQGLFQWINSSHQVAKILELQFQH